MPPIAVSSRIRFAVVLFVLFSAIVPAGASAPEVISPHVRISQVYMGIGNESSPYSCAFVELFNASASQVSLSGWSLQVATNTGSFRIHRLASLNIDPYKYVLISGTCKDEFGAALPTPYVSANTMSSGPTAGRVALVTNQELITGKGDGDIIDYVGYGNTVDYEGSGPAPATSFTTAAARKNGGCTDTDDNSADFTIITPSPRTSASPAHSCPDLAPAVSATTPAGGAVDVALGASLTISFSEPVNVTGAWFSIGCDLGGARGLADATVSGGPVTYIIDLAADLLAGDHCTVTVVAAQVTDQDTNDPPDSPAANFVFSFDTEASACGSPADRIHDIQAASAASPLAGSTRTIEGVVVGDFQGAAGLSGFFVQEETAHADADPLTSEALFVAEGTASTLAVAAGDLVRITGVVAEVDGLTTLAQITSLAACGAAALPNSVNVALPVPTADAWEPYEGMLVTIPSPLIVIGTGDLAALGQVRLIQGDRPWCYTELNAPDAAGFAVFQQDIVLRSITLDDGSLVAHPDPIVHPIPGLSAGHTLRVGDSLPAGLAGVVDQAAGGYRIQPLDSVVFTPANPRPAVPALPGANIRVAGVNLGSYFNGDGSDDFTGSLGASSPAEFTRQRDKLIAALLALDADILGVTHLENDPYDAAGALADLVAGLNVASASDVYAYVNPGAGLAWSSGSATVGIIYRPGRVTPIAAPQKPVTGAFAEPSLLGYVPMAQTFEEVEWGERLTVVVNALPARDGCPADGLDADQGDGQGCWNALRTEAAAALLAWVAGDPTGSGDPDFLWVGAYNAFAREDPIAALVAGGYADLLAAAAAPAYTTVQDGLSAASDRALASPALLPQVTAAAQWHNNADEPAALDYNMEDRSAMQLAALYDTGPYRSADHDPVLVGLSLLPDVSDLGGDYGVAWHTGQGAVRLGTLWGSPNDGVARGASSWNDGQGEVSVTVTGAPDQYACLHAWLDYTGAEPAEGQAHSPDGLWGADEKVISGLPLLSGIDQLVTFAIPAGAIDPAAAYNMRFRLVPAPDPLAAVCTASSLLLAADTLLEPIGRADGGEVEDYTFQPGPLAVRIAAIDASPAPGGILITWETVSEVDNAGFNLYRAPSSGGPWTKLNNTLIPAVAPGSSEGHAYRWLDPSADPAATLYYQLEDLAMDGARTRHEPVEVTPAQPNAVRLSALAATSSLPLALSVLAVALLGAGILNRIPSALCAGRRRNTLELPFTHRGRRK